ncbi:hypothetical protein F6R83_21700 [Citrobacter amalonaticus]|nr:hypothetical protein [Citrobacter amalonaticus]
MEGLYLLNNLVYFDPTTGMLSSSLCFSRKISLSKPASQCLKLLISKQGQVCNYPFISSHVWGERGKWMSHNTIHQHIYQLRTRLKTAGIDKEAIITIPRMGFQLSPNLRVFPVPTRHTRSHPGMADTAFKKRYLLPSSNSNRILYTLLILNLISMLTLITTLLL